MRAAPLAAALLIAPLLGGWGCGPGLQADRPPRIRYGETACARCGMIISEEAAAAGRVRATGETDVFDDIGCLLLATRGDGGRLWVHDAPSAAWIEAHSAWFVHQERQRTPMGFGVLAFADRAQAAALSAEVMPLAEALARAIRAESMETLETGTQRSGGSS